MNNDHIRTFNNWYSPDCCNSFKNHYTWCVPSLVVNEFLSSNISS
jgi:hypothetical protein